MTVNKITSPVSPLEEIDKINEIIDNLGTGLPDQTGQSGKYLTTNGIEASWGTVDALPSQTGNANKVLTTNGTIASWTEQYSRNIGEIVASTIPLSDAGLHLLDGTQLSGDGIYADFVDYIGDLYDSGDYTAIFDTEANWQTAVTTYGVCGKFVYTPASGNDPATVRLPKITGFTEGTIDPAVLGDLVEAGLPNITGQLSSLNVWNYTGIGAFNLTQETGTFATGSGRNSSTLTFDASRSSSIYGNSSTVQPQAIKVLYYIAVATTTKTDIQVDIDEIATDLNMKVDKSSLVELDLQDVDAVIETYQNGSSWYRVYNSGWCEQGGRLVGNNNGMQVTFLKPFANTNYTITYAQANADTNYDGGTDCIRGGSLTTNGFIVDKYTGAASSTTSFWQVCGYLA